MKRTPPRPLRAIALALALSGLAGCVKDDPAFRSGDLTAIPSLVGTWQSAGLDKADLKLTFTADRQSLEAGRLKARPLNTTMAGASGDNTAEVYTLHIESTKSDDARKLTTKALAARAYAVKAGERTLLCVQNDEAEPEGLAPTFTISKQLFIAVAVSGDTLTINWPKVQITLAPSVKLLDQPGSDDAPAPTVDAALQADAQGNVPGATLLTSSPDRALWVYRHYGDRPGFWDEKGLTFTRVIPAK
ncbi:MAG: hypothetical protein Q8L55_16175 [Phycisphaerales bacterium]|nr:hypothetical protein [Phycisphaerales bacterium]